MIRVNPAFALSVGLAVLLAGPVQAQEEPFSRMDVFELEWVQDPQISPDGERVVYVRRGMDIMEDRRTSELWIVNRDGTGHRKLTSREVDESNPRWSPDGSRIAFTSGTETSGREIFVHWMAEGTTARVTRTDGSPSGIAWSPNGEHIAFSKRVRAPAPRLVTPPDAPAGAEWADPPRVETRLNHELDGTGILEWGYDHLFVARAGGGAARQVTSGDFHHSSGPEWTPDGQRLVFSANRNEGWEHERRNTELYSVSVHHGEIVQLTDRYGPAHTPRISPDGSRIAFLGYEDRMRTYQLTRLHTMSPDGSGFEEVPVDLERSVQNVAWDENGDGLYVLYADDGVSRLAHLAPGGSLSEVASDLGGTSIGRPYAGSPAFTVAGDGTIAFNLSSPYRPAELAVTARGQGEPERVTDLSGELTGRVAMGEVQEVWYTSSVDGRDLHGWIITPPDHDPGRPYPLVVELHGGPISHYGPHFSPELQLMASAGYVVFYPNFRGSTSYGEEFGDQLYHAFSGAEYPDVIDGVEYLVEEGVAAADSLYITGGSAGGTATAWAIGMTDRFRAAVVQKPVMNWISKTLAADNWYAYADYRYPGWTWENPLDYWDVSPISLAGEIETPTMVILGERDLRTPTWEAKQLYHALRQRQVETVYVEVPGAWHFISDRPSQLITKVDHILAWFERYR